MRRLQDCRHSFDVLRRHQSQQLLGKRRSRSGSVAEPACARVRIRIFDNVADNEARRVIHEAGRLVFEAYGAQRRAGAFARNATGILSVPDAMMP